MPTQKFVRRLITRILILIFLSIFIFTFLTAASAITSNYIAAGQMENSDELFIIHEMYNKFFRPTLITAFVLIIIYNVIQISITIYKFIISKNENI